MKIIILYTRLANYFFQGLKFLTEKEGAEILIFARKPDPDAPYTFEEIPGIQLRFLEDFLERKVKERVSGF